MRRICAIVAFAPIACGAFWACIPMTTWEPALHSVDTLSQLDPASPIQVHLLSGEVAELSSWRTDETTEILLGNGTLFDIRREATRSGEFRFPFDSIALVETRTRRVDHPGGLTGLVVWSTIMGATTVACVADPKACFGSCPTFYAFDGKADRLMAEGFSASFARVLEARDIDALQRARPPNRRFSIRMVNEALETHAVRHARLLVVPRLQGGTVFATPDGEFFPVRGLEEPVACRADEGDCLAAMKGLDGMERKSLTDSSDLAARETIQLEFPAADGPLGLVLAARHAFVSTFLFYEAMGYFGHNGGEYLASLERGGEEMAALATGMARALGGIEMSVLGDDGTWISVGVFNEAGPIATDVALFPLPAHFTSERSVLRVRLRLAKGSWRADYLALAQLSGPVEPTVLEPEVVEHENVLDESALSRLRDPERYLITYPGDEYSLEFTLPMEPEEVELFLDTKGYYYEWMREEWLITEDPSMASLVLLNPEEALRRLAPAFKKAEPEMERLFWQSRFGR